MESWDPTTKSTLTRIPLLSVKAGPRDGAVWTQRLKEEYKALIAYTSMNKSNDNDWFRISAANPEGTRWIGKCWYIHNLLKYEFDLQFDIPVTYPATAPEIELPQLDGKTQKMYRGGKICLTVHFKPLWAKNWDLIDQAQKQKRVLLTRDAKLLRHEYLIKDQIYRLKSLLKNDQLLEVTLACLHVLSRKSVDQFLAEIDMVHVIDIFKLKISEDQLMSRCTKCNGRFIQKPLTTQEAVEASTCFT